ncbi:MAG: glycosyltransferase family 2 protein [Hydrogenophaga sp.]|jgi:rhamnosyltransferase|nr:glycosyltransferase family 2 protein [Hydrogenophaga sp.]
MPTSANAVCAVVVTFNPEIEELARLLRALQAQACDFVVVDNHSDNADALQKLVAGLPRAKGFLPQNTNIGQAAALNLGMAAVKAQGRSLVLLFDQDSAIPEGFCAQMLRAWDEACVDAPGPVAAIGPRLQDPATGRRVPFRRFERLFDRKEQPVTTNPKLICADFLITSGCLIALDALTTIGAMRADYFIDNVDLEWCFRARSMGYRLYGTEHAVLNHRIGEVSSNYLVRKGVVVQHSALRFYYSTRNRLHLHRQPYAPAVWRTKDALRFVLKTSYLLLTSARRRDYWASLRKALHDVHRLP